MVALISLQSTSLTQNCIVELGGVENAHDVPDTSYYREEAKYDDGVVEEAVIEYPVKYLKSIFPHNTCSY